MTKKILLIDDEQDVREVVRLALSMDRDYEIVEAANGEEGLEKMRAQSPDLVVCDIKMPKMNGYEVVTAMHQDDALKNIPIIVLTSMTDGSKRSDEEWKECMSVTDFLSKPFEPEELIERVEKLLLAPGM